MKDLEHLWRVDPHLAPLLRLELEQGAGELALSLLLGLERVIEDARARVARRVLQLGLVLVL